MVGSLRRAARTAAKFPRALNDARCAVALNELCSTDPRKLDRAARRGRVHAFYNKWRELEVARCRLGRESYASAVAILTRFGYPDKAREMWDEMRGKDVHPTAGGYTSMLVAAAREGDVDGALRLWKEMKADGHRPSVRAYNSMMHLFIVTGDTTGRVEQLADAMERDGVPKNEHTFSHLLRAARSYDRFRAVVEGMCQAGLEPTTVNINAALKGAPTPELCDRMLQFAMGLGVPTDIGTSNALISRYRACGAQRRAVALIPRIPHAFDSYTYNLLIFCCVDLTAAPNDESYKLAESLAAHAWAAEAFTHRTALGAVSLYAKHNQVARAMQVRSSVDLGGSATAGRITELITEACARIGEPPPPQLLRRGPREAA